MWRLHGHEPRGCQGHRAVERGHSSASVSAGHAGETEGELLCSPGTISAWVWKRPEAFSNWPVNCPGLHRLWMALHPPVRLTGHCGSAPPPVPRNHPVPTGLREEC